MSLDTVQHSREIYSVLDFLGDVGGLYSILLDLGSLLISIITFFFGDALQAFLLKSLYKWESFDDARDKSDQLANISSRREINTPFWRWAILRCCCCRSKQGKMAKIMTDIGNDRVEEQLDIVHFLRQQMMLGTHGSHALINGQNLKQSLESQSHWGASFRRQ